MKTIILAGGYGTRLYPLTLDIPKSMVKIAGRPMIEYLIEKINKQSEISEIYIVTNEKFASIFHTWAKQLGNNNITIVNDGTLTNETRLGPIGDLDFLLNAYEINDDVLILGGDNLFEESFAPIIDTFYTKGDTIALYDVGSLELSKQFGTVEIDSENRILSFIEKPENPVTTLCSTMIYAIQKEHLAYIPKLLEEGKKQNRGEIKAGEFFTYLLQFEKIWGYILTGTWFDIGTMEQLEKAEEWIHLKNR